MSNDDYMPLEGTVEEILVGGRYRILLTTGNEVEATLSGKMRKARIRVLVGDQVEVDVSVYDPKKGRITFRKK